MKISHFFALAVICVLPLTGCSDDNDILMPENEVDELDLNRIQTITEGLESALYQRDSFSFYDLSYASNNGWVEQDWNKWVGLSVPGPGCFAIHDGRTWLPVDMGSSCSKGPSKLDVAFSAYRAITGFTKAFYVSTITEFDVENKLFLIVNWTFDLKSVTDNSLKICHIKEYAGGEGGKGGKHKFVIKYAHRNLNQPALNKMLFYDTDLDAKLAMLEMLRTKFGDEININNCYGGRVILNDPIIKLSDIEAEIRAGAID